MLKAKKVTAAINLITSISVLVFITVITKTTFILPPFLATAATKYPDPDWRRPRSFSVLISYMICATVGVIFSLLHLYGLVFATIASFISFIIMITIDVEHPPAVLATFLGVLEKVTPFYLLHPVMTGVIVVEGVNYLVTRYLEPRIF